MKRAAVSLALAAAAAAYGSLPVKAAVPPGFETISVLYPDPGHSDAEVWSGDRMRAARDRGKDIL